MFLFILIICYLLQPAPTQAQSCVVAPNNNPVWSDQFVRPTPSPVPESEFTDIAGGDDVGTYTGGDGNEEDFCSLDSIPSPTFGLNNMYWPLSPPGHTAKKFGAITKATGFCHMGVDIMADYHYRTEVRAIADGELIRTSSGWGDLRTCGVDIMHQAADGTKYVVRYGEYTSCEDPAFLEIKSRISRGDTRVAAGEVIGTVNTENHLHIELHTYESNSQKYYLGGARGTPKRWYVIPDVGGYCNVKLERTSICLSSAPPESRRIRNIWNVLEEASAAEENRSNGTSNANTNGVDNDVVNNSGNNNSDTNAGTVVPDSSEWDYKSAPPTVDDPQCQEILNFAYAQLGKPYVRDTNGPDTFDCAGFVQYVFDKAAGVKIPSGATSIYKSNRVTVFAPDYDYVQPCDLVFWKYSTDDSNSIATHIGIYVGDQNVIHAGKPVKVSYMPEMNELRTPLAFGRVE
ncbi:MAG: NlpC/P60 family protein [bacterium]|nr:NlpC/P60 family protein [bacterium]